MDLHVTAIRRSSFVLSTLQFLRATRRGRGGRKEEERGREGEGKNSYIRMSLKVLLYQSLTHFVKGQDEVL